MKVGVVFPQTDFGAYEPGALRDFFQTVEALGYSHLVAYDHILGANPVRPGGWRGAYTNESAFLEPLVLFGYAAGVTQKLGFLTGILILPQRQTALVAKQAATLDILCQGRLRLGVGLGWNEVEYAALNEDFHNRGRRMEEQVDVLRKLWTQPLVDYQGQWHTIPDAGIKPLPVQQPIPLWFGGTAESALRRTARIADGWLPNIKSPTEARTAAEIVRQELKTAGRDPSTFGIEARIPYGDGNPDTWKAQIREWEELGATLFSINTLNLGYTTPAEHLKALRTFANAIGPFSS
jgi:probable F420-dependent oxidoreductase